MTESSIPNPTRPSDAQIQAGLADGSMVVVRAADLQQLILGQERASQIGAALLVALRDLVAGDFDAMHRAKELLAILSPKKDEEPSRLILMK